MLPNISEVHFRYNLPACSPLFLRTSSCGFLWLQQAEALQPASIQKVTLLNADYRYGSFWTLPVRLSPTGSTASVAAFKHGKMQLHFICQLDLRSKPRDAVVPHARSRDKPTDSEITRPP